MNRSIESVASFFAATFVVLLALGFATSAKIASADGTFGYGDVCNNLANNQTCIDQLPNCPATTHNAPVCDPQGGCCCVQLFNPYGDEGCNCKGCDNTDVGDCCILG